ncbi:Helicase-like protein (plasmid) [Trichormus variabilis ATCC 29413]|uniref:Helicase-like protein n=2 Tax=Anabaena variabilis TaxID=264691 RepID=Q3M132_TRIV2|nr:MULTISPECIES: DISARM system helicase DrmA [Nostocaceae]ABA25311.1 Helicase-like protein [Trichormus variabilis ATCC 29413]MBC1218219.1 helicase [Trichormus variabilis ARAD]MBC1259435.1 helicase [Trichormus variabilis V5]MBC1271047.1 helicase [Trichormus variabilis FSR]MBC1305959.1 helicase [Trichormus variabilis N2B]
MPNTPAEVRSCLIDALQLDLVGPTPNDIAHVDEIIDQAPSKWYLTGFLVPYEASVEQRSEDIGNDDIDEISQVNAGDDEKQPDSASARRAFFPSSMGLSILVPATAKEINVTVHWGDYSPVDEEDEENQEDSKSQLQLPRLWQRTPGQAELTVPLHLSNVPKHWEIPGSNGLRLVTSVRPVTAAELVPVGTRSVSVFLVNYRPPVANPYSDIAFAFQTCLIIRTPSSLVPRPNLRGRHGDDWDEKVADLQYRDDYEYAVGHNVSAVAVTNDDATCQEVRTAWMPIADVEKVVPEKVPGVELGMEALAAAPTVETLRNMMSGIVDAYRVWIEAQKLNLPNDPERLEVANDLLNRATRANKRIAAGLKALDDPNVLEAFQIANRAIATAIRQRLTHNTDTTPESVKPPAWRPFQLAFLLMNLVGIAYPEHPDRELVDLLFFPTGGGKTEAYLGLAAFAMVLRRLRNPTINSAGVSVLMRYTLRLLTLDQLSRAATLVCALELERQKDTQKLGPWPFEIGLWVGQTATPNRMGKKGDNDEYTARARTIAFQNDTRKPSPIPLENCPWCGKRFTSDSFQLLPDANQPKSLQITCINRKCKFTRNQSLPIVAVDEPIYQRLPSFIIATVDKFANLPWVGETGALFGLVDRYDKDGFYGPAHPGRGQALAGHLPAPDLIIQDELHLISGPLGTMVGLYETAIDELSSREINGKKIRPKIIASTATVRRASKQIRALFGRDAVDIFPPPGPDRRDSFFAKTVPASESNARTYVGIAAQGRSLKVVLLRTYLALLGAAQKHYQAAGGAKNPDNPADPYMTLLGYFNSLRELGGSRRIVEDEVNSRLARYSLRKRVNETEGLFADRQIAYEPAELTSRVSTNVVAEIKSCLALPFHEKKHIDVALATNMISVGLDITRLGLMVVLGQPKTASEYIQSTSRVGRDENRPGLVITLLNIHRPRDRSHYERFPAWHTSFYRSVEATSVTPFSPRAIDRGIAAISVALARLGHPGMTAPPRAIEILQHRQDLEYVVDAISDRAEMHDKELDAVEAEALRQKVRGRVKDLLDTWERIASQKISLQYQQEVGQAPPLLFDPLDPELEKQPMEARKFKAQRSLRDVEPTVNLWVCNPDGFEVEEDEK